MFTEAYQKLMITEGGFANHPVDRGGMTFCGISRNHHSEWPGWAMIDGYLKRGVRPEDFKTDFLMGQVKAFYRSEYWVRLSCDLLPQRIALELFDSGVHCGRKTSARWLQHAVNFFAGKELLKEDGIVGEKTVIKTCVQVENYGDVHLLKELNGHQFMYYHHLVEKNPDQMVFYRGWLTRVWED